MQYSTIKIDYTYDENNNLHVLDIGDARSCAFTGFNDPSVDIDKKISALIPGTITKMILDGEVTIAALKTEKPLVFSSFASSQHVLWPESNASRSINPCLHAHGHHQRSLNQYPATMLSSEQHKLYLYIFRDLLNEAKRFVFWDASQDIHETLAELRRLNVVSTHGFFIKVMDHSNGGATAHEVLYAKDFDALRTCLMQISDNPRQFPFSYAIEQAFSSHRSQRNNQDYVVTCRAFLLQIQDENQCVTSYVVSAKTMFPSTAYKGPGKGSRSQFLANISQGQTPLPLDDQACCTLADQLNSERLRPLWKGLFQTLLETDKMIASKNYPIHAKFLTDLPERPYQHKKLLAVEKRNTQQVPATTALAEPHLINSQIINMVMNEIQNFSTLKSTSFSTILGQSILSKLATITLTLALMRAHVALGASAMPDYLNPECYLDYLSESKAISTAEALLDLYMQRFLDTSSKSHSQNLLRMTSCSSDDTVSTLSTQSLFSCTDSADRDASCSYTRASALGICAGRAFSYAYNYPTALAQSIYLSDHVVLRALLFSRIVSITTPRLHGDFPLFHAFGPASKASLLVKQTLLAAVRDQLDQPEPSQTLVSKDYHLNAIYTCHFFNQLLDFYAAYPMHFHDTLLLSETDFTEVMPAMAAQLQAQVCLYLQACRNRIYASENLEKTLRNAVVQADFDTTRMLILTQIADPNHRSPSGKSAVDHALAYCKNPKDTSLDMRQRILSFVQKWTGSEADCDHATIETSQSNPPAPSSI